MAYDDEDDLFAEEFDFVDDDDSELEEDVAEVDEAEEAEEKPVEAKRSAPRKKGGRGKSEKGSPKKKPKKRDSESETAQADDDTEVAAEQPEAEKEPEPEPDPGPPTDHVVFVYEFGEYKRTISREFTDEDSIKFAEEYNRTGKSYGRRAVPANRDEEPEPHL